MPGMQSFPCYPSVSTSLLLLDRRERPISLRFSAMQVRFQYKQETQEKHSKTSVLQERMLTIWFMWKGLGWTTSNVSRRTMGTFNHDPNKNYPIIYTIGNCINPSLNGVLTFFETTAHTMEFVFFSAVKMEQHEISNEVQLCTWSVSQL